MQSQVKERPILMSAPMVRALLEGRKTQTRRVVKPQPHDIATVHQDCETEEWGQLWYSLDRRRDPTVEHWEPFRCPYGKPGDRLWLREAWRTAKVNDHLSPKQMIQACRDAGWKSGKAWAPIEYLSDGYRANWKTFPGETGRYRHARFMPRDYSRITLEITEVRVQRLQDISEADAIAEGVDEKPLSRGEIRLSDWWVDYLMPKNSLVCARHSYASLWDSLNGKREGGRKTHSKAHALSAEKYSWDANPWVWAISFKAVQP